MPRTSSIHCIAPSAINIAPNANGSASDLAVFIERRTTIKVYYPIISDLGTVDGAYQEWTLAGRNRRLANAGVPYTIYARLRKVTDWSDAANVSAAHADAYLVFAAKILEDNEWIDPYVLSPNTSSTSPMGTTDPDGTPRTWVPIPARQAQNNRADYWWVKLGTVSAPDAETGERTVELDTGILGTDQYNEEWALDPDELPLRVEIANSKTAGVPYIAWGETIGLQAHLIQGWEANAADRVRRWTIARDTGNAEADAAWNAVERESFATTGAISISHAHDATDDFSAAVAVTFAITAWGVEESESSENSENSENSELVALATGTITILAETLEKYELALSTHLASYNPTTKQYSPAAGIDVRIRAAAQDGSVFYLTNTQVGTAQLVVLYAPAGASDDDATELHFSGADADEAVVNIPISVFSARQSLDVRLTNAADVGLDATSIAFVRDGEDSKEREWIYRLNNATGYDSTAANRGKQFQDDDFVPSGWTDDPTGVSIAGDTEYASWRDWDKASGQWGAFATPVIWSHYGENGDDGQPGQAVVVDGATVMLYSVQDSDTVDPETIDDWDTYDTVVLIQGKWLWSQATTYYRKAGSAAGSHDAGASVTYNSSYIARDGAAGRGIVSVTEYYKASANATGETAPSDDSGWTTDPNTAMQAWGSSAKYLWNYEKTQYSSGTIYERTAPQVLAIWTENGAAGKGIDSIQDKYKLTATNTPPAREGETGGGTWSNTPLTPTEKAPYLWNYEIITWINPSTTTQTDVQMIGHYGRDGDPGDPGDPGTNGVSVFRWDVDASTPARPTSKAYPPMDASATAVPADGWAVTPPARPGAGYQLWMCTGQLDVQTNTVDSWSSPVRISGDAGRRGTDGDGVEYVYIRTTDNIAPQVEDSSHFDSEGNSYEESNYLPSVYYPDGAQANIERNALDDSQHPDDDQNPRGECTDNPKGVSDLWPYEWALTRTMSVPSGTGARTWSRYAGSMSLWAKWSKDGNPGNPGQPGADAVTYFINSTILSVSIPSGSTSAYLPYTTFSFWKKTGAAEPEATSLYWRVYRRLANGTLSSYLASGTGTTADMPASTYELSAGQSFVVRVFASSDSTTTYLAEYEIYTIKAGDAGGTGKTGPSYYYLGEWYDQTSQDYIATGTVVEATDYERPYVSYTTASGTSYYLYIGEAAITAGGSRSNPGSDPEHWTPMSSEHKFIISQAVFSEFAKLGSAVFNADWMYSQFGNGLSNALLPSAVNINSPSAYVQVGSVSFPVAMGDTYTLRVNAASAGGTMYLRPGYLVNGAYSASKVSLSFTSTTATDYIISFTAECTGVATLMAYGTGVVNSINIDVSLAKDYEHFAPDFMRSNPLELFAGSRTAGASSPSVFTDFLRSDIFLAAGKSYTLIVVAAMQETGATAYTRLFSKTTSEAQSGSQQSWSGTTQTTKSVTFTAAATGHYVFQFNTNGGYFRATRVAIMANGPFVPKAAVDWLSGYAHFGGASTTFLPDGSGHVAGGNIAWDSQGNTTIGGFIYNKPKMLTLEGCVTSFNPLGRNDATDEWMAGNTPTYDSSMDTLVVGFPECGSNIVNTLTRQAELVLPFFYNTLGANNRDPYALESSGITVEDVTAYSYLVELFYDCGNSGGQLPRRYVGSHVGISNQTPGTTMPLAVYGAIGFGPIFPSGNYTGDAEQAYAQASSLNTRSPYGYQRGVQYVVYEHTPFGYNDVMWYVQFTNDSYMSSYATRQEIIDVLKSQHGTLMTEPFEVWTGASESTARKKWIIQCVATNVKEPFYAPSGTSLVCRLMGGNVVWEIEDAV